jgi:ureidoacrylate peracid hydrolase
MTAILLIDLQQEFFDPSGILRERFIPSSPIISSIQALVKCGRQQSYPIIWIRAEYDPMIKSDMDITHSSGRPCCVSGSTLAEFHPDLPIQSGDPIFVKHYYSSFLETDLEFYLRSHKITHLIIAGVTLKNCVYFTACDAYRLGFTVTLVPECTAMSNMADFNSKLKDFEPIAQIQSIDSIQKILLCL